MDLFDQESGNELSDSPSSQKSKKSYPFPVYSGLFEHRERIGSAIWEFLWCINRTTKEEVDEWGIVWGLVLGGKPVKLGDIAAELDSTVRTVQRNMARLKEQGYIKTTRAYYGEVIKVRHSKRRRDTKKEVSKMEHLSNQDTEVLEHRIAQNGISHMERYAKSGISDSEKSANNGTSHEPELPDVAHLDDKNGASKKILLVDKTKKEYKDGLSDSEETVKDGGVPTTGGSVPQEIPSDTFARIERHLADKMAQLFVPHGDLVKIQKFLVEGITEEVIINGITIAFSNYRPKYEGDRIRSITYCEPVIRELYHRLKERSTKRGESNHSTDRTSVQGDFRETETAPKRKWDEFEYGNGEE